MLPKFTKKRKKTIKKEKKKKEKKRKKESPSRGLNSIGMDDKSFQIQYFQNVTS